MNFKIEQKYLILMCLSGLIISLDQISKLYVHTQFQLHETVPVIQNFFHLTYVRNYGAAFGFLSQAPEAFRELFFLMIPPIACLTIIFILKGIQANDRAQAVALSGIFAGAIGNYIDRLQFRYVIDFLDFHYGSLSWPAFNVADMTIVGGVGLLVFLMIKESRSGNPT